MQIGMLRFEEPPNDQTRKIIHIDMDAFYASVEERDNPALKGKPLVISPHPRTTGGRGVVTTANYVARKYGIHSAMSSQKAYELCPTAIFIPPNFEKYREVSRQIRQIYESYTDVIEPLALDEAYLDVTQNKRNVKSATIIARRIQKEVWQKVHLTCSAGVSYNKFLAKVASDFQKPAGLTVVPPQKAQDFLFQLPIDKFYGVGEKTAERLKEMRIQNGADLYRLSHQQLTDSFGKMGYSLYRKVRGIDNSPVRQDRERKSLGKEHTYNPFLISEEQVETELRLLAQGVAATLSRHRMHGRVVVLKIRYADFITLTRQKSYLEYNGGWEDIYEKALALWLEHGELEKEVRLLGITITQLDPVYYENVRLPLWETENF